MSAFSLSAAKARLPELVARAEAGEEIVLVRGGKPVAKLIPVQVMPRVKRKFGRLKGRAFIGPEFFEPLPEDELRLWEGR